MKRIGEISPVKDLTKIVSDEIFEIADRYLPRDCFWREGKKIHIEVLRFIICLSEENVPISTESICFYCSVQQSPYYED